MDSNALFPYRPIAELRDWVPVTPYAKQLFDLSDDLWLVLGKDGALKEVNRAWTRLLGWPPLGTEPQGLLELLPPEERSAWASRLEHLRPGETFRDLECRLRTHAGPYRWMRFGGTTEDAERIFLLGRDIHLDKEREAFLSLFFESSSVGLNLCAMDGTWIRSNPCFLSMIGYSREQADGKLSYWQLTPPKYREEEQRQLARLREEGRYGPYEKEFIRADGTLVPVRLNGFVIQKEGQPFIWSIIEDISKERSLHSQLEAKSTLFEAIVENVPTALFVKDVRDDFRVTLWNRAAEEVFRRPRESVVGKTAHDAWPKEQADRFRSDDQRVVDEDRLVDIPEEPSSTPDGETIVLHTRKVPLRLSPTDEPSLLLAISEDITERKKLEADLRAAIETRDDFLSIASHELKTPLTALSLQLQVLSQLQLSGQSASQERVGAMVGKALAATRRLNVLIGELLDITRIRVGKLTLQKQETDLTALVQGLLAMTSEEIRRSGSEVLLVAKGPVRGMWDPNRIHQVVSNLLSNALKFGAGRPIEIGVELEAGGRSVQLTVTDHGRGIPLELQRAVFERFQRGESATQVAGLGLGLYIVRQLVEAHGGSISVKSAPGQGATFRVHLPLA